MCNIAAKVINPIQQDIRQRGNQVAVDVSGLNGGVSPVKAKRSFLNTFAMELGYIFAEPQTKKISIFLMLNILTTVILLIWCNSTDSMALSAFTYLTIFDIFSLLTCLVSIWVKTKQPTSMFSFGYERFEVLAVFSSTILAQLGALFIFKESIERMVEQPDIHEGRLLLGTALAFFIHILVSYGIENTAFSHVVSASSSSWLQEHVTDISESLCSVLPGMSKLLLPRINPFALIGTASAAMCVITYFLIDVQNYHAFDTWAAVWIALMTAGTMFPMTVYTGKILLQTTPSHMISQLDKCLREASTLDGVLEFRHEHFWTLHFGAMAGSVHVRVRRDADEQMVLAHVYHRLSNLVPVLTIQIFKDDWKRPNSFQILGDTSLFNKGIAPGNASPPQLNTPQSSPYSTLNSTSQFYKPATNLGPSPVAASLTYPQSLPQLSGLSNSTLNLPPSTNPASINMNKLNTDILNLLGSTKAPSLYSSSSSISSAETVKNTYTSSGVDNSKTVYSSNSNFSQSKKIASGIYTGVNPANSTSDTYSPSSNQLLRTEPEGESKTHFS